MNPITYTYDWGVNTDIARKKNTMMNISNFKKVMKAKKMKEELEQLATGL